MIKEYVQVSENGYTYCLKLENYGKSFEDIENLWKEAVKDFPKLSKREAKIVHYSSPKYYGIEFTLNENPPKSYSKTTFLSSTL